MALPNVGPVNLAVDSIKVKKFVETEARFNELKAKKDAAEKKANELAGELNMAKNAAKQGMGPWLKAGELFMLQQQAQDEFEKISQEVSNLQNDVNAAKPVLMEEVLRAARQAAGA